MCSFASIQVENNTVECNVMLFQFVSTIIDDDENKEKRKTREKQKIHDRTNEQITPEQF